MAEVSWRRVNSEPFEYAIQQGLHGDEFVKLFDGSCLRRPFDEDRARPLLDRLSDGVPSGIGATAILLQECYDEIERLRAALNEVLTSMSRCDYPCDLRAHSFRERFGIPEQRADR